MTAISQGGAAKRVKVLTAADLKANGGSYALEGRPPLAVYGVSEAETKAQGGQFAVEGNIAQPVYIVDTPDGAVTGNVPVPMIAVEGALAVGNVAIPVYVVGGSLGGLDPVTNLTLAIGNAPANDEIDVSWDAVTGATLYRIRYSTDGVDWTEIDTTAGTTYTLTSADFDIDAVTHYVEVRAENGGGESEWAQETISGLLVSLVAYWTMNEDSGTRADSAGDNDLTDNNTVGAVPGIIGNAALFVAANNEYLECADDVALNIGGGDFSIQAWHREETASPTEFQGIMGKDHFGVGREWLMQYEFSANTIQFYLFDAGGGVAGNVASAGGLTRDVRRHVMITRSGAALAMRLNNGTATNGTVTGTPVSSTSLNFRIGSDNLGSSSALNGDVDEVGIWKGRELSVAQRAAIYNGGAGLAYPFS